MSLLPLVQRGSPISGTPLAPLRVTLLTPIAAPEATGHRAAGPGSVLYGAALAHDQLAVSDRRIPLGRRQT